MASQELQVVRNFISQVHSDLPYFNLTKYSSKLCTCTHFIDEISLRLKVNNAIRWHKVLNEQYKIGLQNWKTVPLTIHISYMCYRSLHMANYTLFWFGQKWQSWWPF